MNYRKNLYPGLLLSIISIIYLVFSAQIEIFTGSGSTPLNARFMPRLWGSLLLLLSLILVYRGIKQLISTSKSKEDIPEKIKIINLIRENKEVVLSFIALFIYVVTMKYVGFLITTAIYIYIQILILTKKEKRNYVLPAIVAVVFSCSIYFVFVYFFNVLLPAGILNF